jgi:hypothetical protein
LAHAARAAKSATSSIPILFVISDSVDEGLVTSGYGGFALSGCSVSVSRSLVGLPRRLMYQTDPLLYWENERAKVQLGISPHLPHEANLLHVHFDKQVRLALWGGTHNGAGMTGAQTSGQGFLYNAFISYRHVDRDRQWAASLINALKGYCAFNAGGRHQYEPDQRGQKDFQPNKEGVFEMGAWRCPGTSCRPGRLQYIDVDQVHAKGGAYESPKRVPLRKS